MDASLDQVRAQMLALLPRLRRFALALTGQTADADDLLQDTVERALRNLAQFTPGTRLDSWLYRIAQNHWIDIVRSRAARGQTSNAMEEAEKVPFDGSHATEMHLMLAATRRAMMDLPEDQRAVVALVLIDGLSYREAAEILEVPIGTVTSRLSRAREYLAARIQGEEKSR